MDIAGQTQVVDELKKLNRALQTISNCNHALLHASNEMELLSEICRIVVDIGGYRMAWVGYAEDDEVKSVRPVAQAGFDDGYLETVKLSWADVESGQGPTGRAIRTGRPCVVNDLAGDSRFLPWIEEARKRGYTSSQSFPLKQGERVFGALAIYSALPNAFNAEETKLLISLADNLAYGITMLKNSHARERAEEEFHQSEARYRSLFQNKHTVMLIIDPENGRIVDANEAAVIYYGWELAELCQMNISQINLLTKQEVAREMELASNAKRNYFLFRHRLSNGSIRDVEVFSSPIPFHDKFLLYSIINDITERTKIEKELFESERRFRSITEQMVEMVFVADDSGHLIYVSSVMAKMFGYTPHEAIGHHFSDYLAEEEIPRAFIIFNNALQDFSADQIIELQLRKKNGTIFDGEVHLRNYHDQDSFGIIGLVRDISARKRYEQEILESKEFLKDIYDEVNHSIFVVDVLPDGSYHFKGINPVHELLTGISSAEIAGKTPAQLLPPVFAEQVIEHYTDCIREGHSIQYEEHLPFMGKETLWETVLNPVRNELGIIHRIIGTSTDITERRQNEEERAKLEIQLQQSQKMEMVGRLAGGIAHDFNNMLTVILGHSEMALELFDPTEEAHSDLEAIRQAATRSADLTRQLLAFARKQLVIPKVFELNTAVEELLPMLRRLIGEHIKLVWIPDGKNSRINIDPSQIDQILVNLCINARDAITGNGSITIESGSLSAPTIASEVSAVTEGHFSEYVTLSVRDDGCGIDPNNLEHIFEPFFTTKEQGKGTGLGLSMVYGIVKQNNGTVECQSEPDKGTTITINMPLYRALSTVDQQAQFEQLTHEGHQTILLVEDELPILNLCKLILERNGYNVIAAATPQEALMIVEKYSGTIDLLLTDVIMPEMNGSELSKKLRVYRPELKILFMSGFTADVIARNSVLDTGVNFIQKPFSIKSLSTAVYTIFHPGK